ncbi:MAG: hypothetical protein ACRDKS_11850 [Actinomycetota bacterium]
MPVYLLQRILGLRRPEYHGRVLIEVTARALTLWKPTRGRRDELGDPVLTGARDKVEAQVKRGWWRTQIRFDFPDLPAGRTVLFKKRNAERIIPFLKILVSPA